MKPVLTGDTFRITVMDLVFEYCTVSFSQPAKRHNRNANKPSTLVSPLPHARKSDIMVEATYLVPMRCIVEQIPRTQQREESGAVALNS
jgi:hypothetical protein